MKTLNLAAGVVGLLLSTSASAMVIDFEGFAAGTIIDDEYAGLTISAITESGGSPDVAVIFDSNNPSGGDIDLAAPFTSSNPLFPGPFNPGNILVLQENAPCSMLSCDDPDDDAAGGKFVFEWDEAVNITSIDFFDIESEEEGGWVSTTGAVLVALDENGGNAGFWQVPDTGGDNTWERLVIDAINVTRLEVVLFGSGAIDNIVLNNTPVVPLPAAAWLMLSGLMGLIPIARKRKANAN